MQNDVARYDRIGLGYAGYRRPDPRIARMIADALGDARSVVNIGAGAGSYEPADRELVAVEPSGAMIAQRPAGSAPAVQCGAEKLPFPDRSFDAAMAVLTMHHWSDLAAGIAEMRRVTRGAIVLLTWDPDHPPFWLYRDYFPDALQLDQNIFVTIDHLVSLLGNATVRTIPIPHDCVDGFFGAYWRRPASYLDAGARAAISTFSRLDGVEPRIERLRADLESGEWERRNAGIMELDRLDVGYRLVVARPENPSD